MNHVVKLGSFAIVLAACGEVSDPNKLPDAPVQDGPADDADIDALPIDAPPPRCDPSKAFGTPALVTELNSGGQDIAPALTPDELTLTFHSTRSGGPGGVDAYISTRASTSAAWGAPSLIAGVNTVGDDGRAHMTADRLTMYLEYKANSSVPYDIVSSTRATTAVAFPTPAPVAAVNKTGDDTAVYVLPDHSAMYLVNTRALHRATRTGTTWSAPVLVTGTDLQSGDFDYPIVTPDELTLYFSSSRSPTTGSGDIWVATRSSVVTGFDAPTPVTALNSASSESPGWISADNCTIYFARNVGAASPNYEIYRAEKPL
jgi:hypothetical protein